MRKPEACATSLGAGQSGFSSPAVCRDHADFYRTWVCDKIFLLRCTSFFHHGPMERQHQRAGRMARHHTWGDHPVFTLADAHPTIRVTLGTLDLRVVAPGEGAAPGSALPRSRLPNAILKKVYHNPFRMSNNVGDGIRKINQVSLESLTKGARYVIVAL